MLSRRQLLRVGCAAVPVGLTGCSALNQSPPNLDFSIENRRDETLDVGVRVLRPDGTDRSDATVYRDTADVAPAADGEPWRVTDIAPARPYRVEVRVGPSRTAYHYHYVPDCAEGIPSLEPTLALTLDAGGGVTFSQTECR